MKPLNLWVHLLGEQYLALNVGFEDPELGTAILKDGDTIQDTKSAMVLEDLIGQFLFGSKGDDNKNSGDAPAAAPGNNENTEPVGTTKNKNSGDAPAAAPGNNENTEPVGTTK